MKLPGLTTLAVFGVSASVHAAGPLKGLPVAQDTSNARYAADLVSGDGPKQTYAARVLRRRVRSAWRLAVRDGADFRTIEARQTLSEFDDLVAPRCIRQLSNPNVQRPCAQILGMLETKTALLPLRNALSSEPSRCNERAIWLAIRRIEAAQ